MQTIKPAGEFLFCKPIVKDTTTKSGIIIAQTAQVERKVAEVINVGPQVKDFSAHDEVIYKEYASTDVELEGGSYILIAASDVLGTVVNL